MKDMKTTFRFSAVCAALFLTAAEPVFPAYPGKVEGIKLEDSPAVYAYSGGTVLKDGMALPDGTGEAERVKRVALFYLWLDRDPFFLNPGAGGPGLTRTLAKIAALEAGVTGVYATREGLYPVAFLTAYAEASLSYNRFSASPSEAGAGELLEKIKRGVEAYASEAEKISASVLKFFARRRLDRLAGLGGGGITDKATLTRDFDLIKRNGAAAAGRLEELAGCLKTDSTRCRPAWPVLREPAAHGSPKISPFKPARLGLEGKKVDGPYLVRARCWHGQPDNYFYYSERCQEDGLCLNWDYLATDMLFHPLHATEPPHKELMEKEGLKLQAWKGSSLYNCGDKEYIPVLYDLARFEKVSDLSAFEGADLAALPAPAAAKAEAAIKAEAAFFAEKIKSQAALERLGRAYFETLKEVDGVEVPFKEELRRRSRLINLAADGLEYTLGRVYYHVSNPARTLARLPRGPVDEIRFAGMFIARNFYSIMFMPYSPTVWRLAEKPAYVATMETTDDGGRTLHYDEAVRLYGLREVEKAVKFYSRTAGTRTRFAPE